MRYVRHTAAVAALLVLGVQTASANLPKKVLKQFKGKILVTADAPLSTSYDSEAEMIRAWKKADTNTLAAIDSGAGTAVWSFYIMAIMKTPPRSDTVSLDFYRVDGNKKTYVANERLTGLSPQLKLLATRVELSEDDGLDRGKSYLVKLTVRRGKREVVLATTSLKTR